MALLLPCLKGSSCADKRQQKRTAVPGNHARGEVLCVSQFDNSFPVINLEIIVFWSYSEISLDWGFLYALQSKNSWTSSLYPPSLQVRNCTSCEFTDQRQASECWLI